jgi:hypothetical protein
MAKQCRVRFHDPAVFYSRGWAKKPEIRLLPNLCRLPKGPYGKKLLRRRKTPGARAAPAQRLLDPSPNIREYINSHSDQLEPVKIEIDKPSHPFMPTV